MNFNLTKSRVSKVDKFTHLKDLLEVEVSSAITCLSLIEENYGAAIKELEKYFGGELMAGRITAKLKTPWEKLCSRS